MNNFLFKKKSNISCNVLLSNRSQLLNNIISNYIIIFILGETFHYSSGILQKNCIHIIIIFLYKI